MHKIFYCYLFFLLIFKNLVIYADEFTFGYEIEFSAPPCIYKNKVVSFPNRKPTKYCEGQCQKPFINDTKKYSYLEPEGMIEESGRIEINSKVYVRKSSLNQMFVDIKGVIKDLEKNIKVSKVSNVHIHMRFKKSKIPSNKVDDFKGWLCRVQDYILAWRLEKRTANDIGNIIVLKGRTQTRNPPHKLALRGTIRLLSDHLVEKEKYRGTGEYFDLEIRGYMKSLKKYQKIIEIIINAIENPKMINGFIDQQKLMYRNPFVFSKLNNKQAKFIDQLFYYSTHTDKWKEIKFIPSNLQIILPLMGFEYSPYIFQDKRDKIKEENIKFEEQILKILDLIDVEDNKFQELQKIKERRRKINPFFGYFRNLISNWTKNVQLEKILEESLFKICVCDQEHLYSDVDFYKWLIAHSFTYGFEESVMNIISNIPEGYIKKIFEEKFLNQKEKYQLMVLLINCGRRFLYKKFQKQT